MTLMRRFLALVVAAALAGAAVVVIVEAVGIRVDRSPVLFPIDDWEHRITDGSWNRWSADADPGFWLVVVLGISGHVLVLALVWLSRQFASRPGGPHLSTVVLDAGRRGRTTLEPVGLARVIAQDLETTGGVRKAKVRIRSVGQEPAMWVRLTVDRAADPDEVLERAEPVMQRAARSLGAPGVNARIRIDFAGRDESRVV